MLHKKSQEMIIMQNYNVQQSYMYRILMNEKCTDKDHCTDSSAKREEIINIPHNTCPYK